MKIKVKNFQSLADVDLEVEGFTVVVGPSNIGKSALVRAISSALYGRPGDDFIRRGAKQTGVVLEELPTNSGTSMSVAWIKGAGTNKFVIDGKIYDKMNRDVPVELEKAGVRVVKIGQEYIRPQVASQFESLFLLDKPGSFVSDVMTVVSRLAVLLNAQRSCSSDLKQTKSTAKVRASDLVDAEASLLKLEPIGDLGKRVEAIRVAFDQTERLTTQVVNLRDMADRRSKLKGVGDLSQLPVPVVVLADLGAGLVELRKLVGTRKRFLGLPKLPERVVVSWENVEKWLGTIGTLRELLRERGKLFPRLRQSQGALKSSTEEMEQAEADLTRLRSELKICPVCDTILSK